MPVEMGPTFEIEIGLLRKGYTRIAGVDEAGRGALAGPLALGLVVYDASIILSSPESLAAVNDSKKLTPRQRMLASDIIRTNAAIAAWTLVSHKIVDRLNVNRATAYALDKMLASLPVADAPDIVLLDGNFNFKTRVPIVPVKKGDSLSMSIASASIMGKVNRDAVMDKFDALYDGYYFRKNKGYGTKEHISKLHNKGLTPIHRRSYDPVKTMLLGKRCENGEN